MIEGGQASLKVWEDRKGVVRGLEKLRREIKERVLSQMATYWFVIDKLDIEKAQKSEVRQVAKDVVKSLNTEKWWSVH